QVWRTLIPWSKLDSLGHMDEVLAGDTYNPQLESVPEQSWSSTAFLSTAVRGLFGLEVNAETSTLTLGPHLPTDWDHASLRRVRIGNATLDFSLHQTINALTLKVENSGSPVRVLYRPEIPLGARAMTATVGGHKS